MCVCVLYVCVQIWDVLVQTKRSKQKDLPKKRCSFHRCETDLTDFPLVTLFQGGSTKTIIQPPSRSQSCDNEPAPPPLNTFSQRVFNIWHEKNNDGSGVCLEGDICSSFTAPDLSKETALPSIPGGEFPVFPEEGKLG